MGAQERYIPDQRTLTGLPYLFVDRLQVSRPTALGGHSMPVLMAIGTNEAGNVGIAGATIILDSLEQAWERLLVQLAERMPFGVKLFVSAAPEQCQALALRHFPTARWQAPLKSFYESVLQNVPPAHASTIASRMQAIHAQSDRVSAEHAAAAALGALTAIGLWETGIQFANTYHQTLTYFEFPAHLRRTLCDNDAFDALIDSFVHALSATGQFRGCSIRRMSQFESDADVTIIPAVAPQPPASAATHVNVPLTTDPSEETISPIADRNSPSEVSKSDLDIIPAEAPQSPGSAATTVDEPPKATASDDAIPPPAANRTPPPAIARSNLNTIPSATARSPAPAAARIDVPSIENPSTNRNSPIADSDPPSAIEQAATPIPEALHIESPAVDQESDRFETLSVYEEIELTDPQAPPGALDAAIESELIAHPFGVPLLDEPPPSRAGARSPKVERTIQSPPATPAKPAVEPPRLQWRTRLTSLPDSRPPAASDATTSRLPVRPQRTSSPSPQASSMSSRQVSTVVPVRKPVTPTTVAPAAHPAPVIRPPVGTPTKAPSSTARTPGIESRPTTPAVAARPANATTAGSPQGPIPLAALPVDITAHGLPFVPTNARPLRRYLAAGGAAAAINFAIFTLATALMTPVETLSAKGSAQFVQFIDYVPANAERPLPVPTSKGLFTAETHVEAAPPKLPFKNIATSALTPPPIDLAPAPRYDSRAPATTVAAARTAADPRSTGDASAAPAGAPITGTNQSGAGSGIEGSGNAGGTRSASTPARRKPEVIVNAKPSHRVPPEYPPEALNAGLEGVVTIEFEINGDGSVRDPRIVEAVPPGVFDTAALNAIRQWRYTAQADAAGDIRRARQSMLFSLRH
jgi:TonB family protein